jgi:TPR repeat protein
MSILITAGLCYANGNGVAKNPAEAVRLYSLSANQGNADAQLRLGTYGAMPDIMI